MAVKWREVTDSALALTDGTGPRTAPNFRPAAGTLRNQGPLQKGLLASDSTDAALKMLPQ